MSRRAPSTAAERRFVARARQARRRRLGRVTLAVAVVVTIGGLGWLIGWSDVLAAENVRVTGVSEPLADEVAQVAEVPLGTPLIRIDDDAIAERVSELRDVAQVSVTRSWPSTVTVEVTPRTPVAAVPSDDGWWQVDADGVLFGSVADRPEGLPVLDVGRSDEDAAAREAGVAVVAALPDDVAGLVESVQAVSAADVRLRLADDVVVRWGTAQDSERKAEVLLALMAAQEETPRQYDVSAPEAPAVDP